MMKTCKLTPVRREILEFVRDNGRAYQNAKYPEWKDKVVRSRDAAEKMCRHSPPLLEKCRGYRSIETKNNRTRMQTHKYYVITEAGEAILRQLDEHERRQTEAKDSDPSKIDPSDYQQRFVNAHTFFPKLLEGAH